tara:strand:- start:690 stop:1094 length:405 start_codon:yes stop_codon:yes gene_type:complete
MQEKKNKIWYRYTNDKKGLHIDCVDLISKSYLELGQKPTTETITLMAALLLDDLAHNHSNMDIEEVAFAFNKGIRDTEDGTSAFINVRSWSVWLGNYKKRAQLARQQNRLTEYQKHRDNVKYISDTINKAKKLK